MSIDPLPLPTAAPAPTQELHELLDNAAGVIEAWTNQFKLRGMWQSVRALAECAAMLRQSANEHRPAPPRPEPEPEYKRAIDDHAKLLRSLGGSVGRIIGAVARLSTRMDAMEKPPARRPKKLRRKR